MPRGRPRTYEDDGARRQARNQRRTPATTQTPSGLEPDFGHTLIRMEGSRFDASSRGYAGSPILSMHPQKATGALAAFY
ncbi:hypothetical protein IFM47457_10162 [Aspergillus lentulus]|nr:hypothetical protein IFM47457_10162 [Aspergillus lentulus]